MSKTWVIVDVSSLCYKLFFGMPDLEYEGIKSAVIFGFIKHVGALQDMFQSRRVVFCFDVGQSKRCEIFPEYKAKRRARRFRDEETQRKREILDLQMENLRTRYLPAIGYNNVFGIQGYEADDLIASIALRVRDAIIVSSDQDFFQLLSPGVRQWLPDRQRMMTLKRFQEAYAIEPKLWAVVKAMTGCTTDEVPGVEGVALKTALRYVKGELPPTWKTYERLQAPESRVIIERNRQLVKLPLYGTPRLPLYQDDLSLRGWEKVCDHLGMKSIRGELPPGLRGASGNDC